MLDRLHDRDRVEAAEEDMARRDLRHDVDRLRVDQVEHRRDVTPHVVAAVADALHAPQLAAPQCQIGAG